MAPHLGYKKVKGDSAKSIRLRYDDAVRRTFLMTVCAALVALGASGQVNGVPPSVTSLGPGRSFAPPASVTSLGPRGFTNAPILLGAPIHFQPGLHRGGHIGFSRHRGSIAPIIIPYAVPVYYGSEVGYDVAPESAPAPPDMGPDMSMERRLAVPMASPQEMSPEAESRYGTHYLDQRETAAAPAQPQQSPSISARQSAAEPEPETILVFKDGHQLQITNYAIQGATLFNLSGEGPRKIALADLDMDATAKANDDRGINFKLP